MEITTAIGLMWTVFNGLEGRKRPADRRLPTSDISDFSKKILLKDKINFII